jgi:nitrite reductase/ring-hydroxylating ferredoxin subunit
LIRNRALPLEFLPGRGKHKGELIGQASEVQPGTILGFGMWAVGNAGGRYFAVTRSCRHMLGDLAKGSIDRSGCLVCPVHGARYDVRTGRMVRGPRGIFARVPGLGLAYKGLTRVLPLGRARVIEREGNLYFG